VSEPAKTDADQETLDFAELQKIAADILGVEPDRVQLDVSFAKDLAADSLDLVELIMAIEDKYHVSLAEDELDRMKKVGDLWTFLLASSPATEG
jgi:acyl carrier protein